MKETKRQNFLLVPVVAALAYMVLGLLLLKYFHHIMYKDEVCFISIAEKYARGEFLAAVNSYWSPLLSWLLAGLIFLGLPSAVAAKLLSLLIGLFTFFSARSLSYLFDMSGRVRQLVLFLLVPILLYCSLIFFTPDLLLAGLLTLYFSVILSRRYADRPYAGLLCGALGALAYFSKLYAFFFFLVHFPLLNLLHYLVNKEKPAKRVVLRNCACGLMLFFVLVTGWVYALNYKYHEVTVGFAGRFNYLKNSVGDRFGGGGPLLHIGFVQPPNASAISAWEDPFSFYPLMMRDADTAPGSRSFDLLKTLKNQIRLVKRNLMVTGSALQDFSVLSITILSASMFLCLAPGRVTDSRLKLIFGLVTLGVYPAGYILVYTEGRYLWPVWILIILLGGHVVHKLFETDLFRGSARKALLLMILSASFLKMPVVELINDAKWARPRGRSIYALGRDLEKDGLNGAKIASNDDYGAGVCVAYQLKAKYYGVAKINASEHETVEDLKRNGIQYYFVFDDGPVDNAALEKIKELQGEGLSLSVYAVKY